MKEIVIKIDDNLHERIKNLKKLETIYCCTPLIEAAKNGKELPKGHGGLVDVGQCDRRLFYQQCGGADSLITVKTAFDMLMSLPPIIEADKGDNQ